MTYKAITDPKRIIEEVTSFYSGKGEKYIDIKDAYSLRLYLIDLNEKNNNINCSITKVFPNGKLQEEEKGVIWHFEGKYREKEIFIKLIDNKDVLYAIWDFLEIILHQKNTETIKNLTFHLRVRTKKEGYNQKQKLILFFSKPGNWGRLWKYSELREAMSKEGLAMIGRGIEGERPREFRYDLGYPFITSEQDKKVPDGYCTVEFPFPTQPRNERRNPNYNLERKDWSVLTTSLEKNPKKLRCYECGLFEGEINKIGQETKFQKSHLQCHLSGGNVSKENIVAICQYCNSEQKNIYDYDKLTGKKIYNTIPFVKTRDYKTKKELLQYLIQTMKNKDIKEIVISHKRDILSK